ncbi:MAG: MarR family winged helix-turn-helix transcriptional regulator [Gammaproteobacteria bacterium]
MADLAQTARLLLFNTGALYRLLHRRAQQAGIRWSGLMVLNDLAQLGPLSQRELADIEQVRPATLSLLVKELLTEGLVSREADENDRRAVRVCITPAGRDRLERDATRLAQVLEKALESLGDAALAELVRGEERLAQLLHNRESAA